MGSGIELCANQGGGDAMRRVALCVIVLGLMFGAKAAAQDAFPLEQVLSAPFVSNLVAAKTGSRLAWTLNQEGKRNIWVAEAPSFTARQLTTYNSDDGGELSDVQFTEDGSSIVFTRGEGKNSAGQYANPTSNPAGVEQTVWMIGWSGGTPTKIDAGNFPMVSVKGMIAYERDANIWLAATQGTEKPKQIVLRGKNSPVAWSPDGTRLLLVSDRGDHSFIVIYDTASQKVEFIEPSVDSDSDPVWSPDGKRVAFVRQPAVTRDSPEGYFIEPDRSHPWAIWVADAATAKGHDVWQSTASLQGSYPYMANGTGGGVLNWAAQNNLVFASEEDGWQHLYTISAEGGSAKPLTPGNCEVEQWSFSRDKATIVFNSNCGDVDRRHMWRIGLTGSSPQQLTKGEGIEWAGVFVGDEQRIAYLGSDAQHRGQAFVLAAESEATPVVMPAGAVPSTYPAEKLIAPQQVIFKSGDGLELHGQLFLPKNLKPGAKRPALIFLHGGPMRQMLLGWHYMYYYSNAYGMNQYLASRGYIVLAVNYRSGIGYGRAFREAAGRAGRGASEYQDVVAAGKWLQARADVDGKHIGVWGGSYGGYLTALGLGRDSALFAAGVDMHGVHDWPTDNWEGKNIKPELTKLAHDSSPVNFVDTWKSPVLFIHGDDDRNVIFSQTVDLIARLRPKGVFIEQLVFPDDVHDFMLNSNWLKAYHATSDFFDRQFGRPQK
jgi:dipeptidyl aminopeptidase/acylaminoacyl peptidase